MPSPTPTPNPTVQNGISYPDSVYFGKNILSYPDSTLLIDGVDYELGAILEKDASLYVIFTNYSDTIGMQPQPIWGYSNQIGWLINGYNTSTNTQKFTSSLTDKIRLQLQFMSFGSNGNCRIDFYENSTTITRTKYFRWQ